MAKIQKDAKKTAAKNSAKSEKAKSSAKSGSAKVAAAKPKTAKVSAAKSVKSTKAKTEKASTKNATKATAKPAAKSASKGGAAKASAKNATKPTAKATAKKAAKSGAAKAPAKNAKAAAKPAAKIDSKKTSAAKKSGGKIAAKEKLKSAAKNLKAQPKGAASAPKKKPVKFRVNQKIVYPSQGVGKIIEISEQAFKGEKLLYYKIYIEASDMIVMVPVDMAHEHSIRAIVSAAEAEKALKLLSEEFEPITSDWKLRYQMNLDLLKKGGVNDIATIVRCLYNRSKVKELPIQERRLYDSAKKLLEDEIAFALGKSPKDAQSLIHAKLEPPGSAPKAKRVVNMDDDEDDKLMDDMNDGAGDDDSSDDSFGDEF